MPLHTAPRFRPCSCFEAVVILSPHTHARRVRPATERRARARAARSFVVLLARATRYREIPPIYKQVDVSPRMRAARPLVVLCGAHDGGNPDGEGRGRFGGVCLKRASVERQPTAEMKETHACHHIAAAVFSPSPFYKRLPNLLGHSS